MTVRNQQQKKGPSHRPLDWEVDLHFQHVLAILEGTAIAGKLVFLGRHRPPFRYVEFVGCFDLPIFDKVLNHPL